MQVIRLLTAEFCILALKLRDHLTESGDTGKQVLKNLELQLRAHGYWWELIEQEAAKRDRL